MDSSLNTIKFSLLFLNTLLSLQENTGIEVSLDFNASFGSSRVICNFLFQTEQNEQQREIIFAFDRSPPPIEWHIRAPEDDWNILTVSTSSLLIVYYSISSSI